MRFRMQKGFGCLGLGLIVLPFAGAFAAPADSALAGPPCDVGMLKGLYAYSEQGVIYPLQGVPVKADFVQVGTFVLDGKGGGNGKADISVNGTTTRNVPLLNITYTVNADCTGEAGFLVPDPTVGQKIRKVSFAVGDKGNQIHYISLEANSSLKGVAQKR